MSGGFKTKAIMSTIKNETDLSGVFGESVSFRKVNGRIVAKNRPQRKQVALSPAQVEHREKFQEAASYAKAQMDDAEAKSLYKSRITTKKQSPFALAVRDYLVAPTVKSIEAMNYRGAVGDAIVIKAIDDFMVTKVTVIITDSSGAVIEQGDCTQNPKMNFLWDYQATVANPTLPGTKISAIAFDRPGNKGSLENVLE
jgi:hypothetical protein